MRIDPAQHGWMTAPETIQVMNALGDARFVGGPRRAKWPSVSCARYRQALWTILRDNKKNRRRDAN
jgi:hypothetical protein